MFVFTNLAFKLRHIPGNITATQTVEANLIPLNNCMHSCGLVTTSQQLVNEAVHSIHSLIVVFLYYSCCGLPIAPV